MASVTPGMLTDMSYEGLKTVYDGVYEETMSLGKPQRPASFELLIYAARSILHPTLLLNQIPDLLVLLASIDMIRDTLMKAAVRFHNAAPLDAHGEDATEDHVVQHIQTHDSAIRGSLRTAVNNLASLHIHTLLRFSVLQPSSRKPKAEDHLPLYFPDYLGHTRSIPENPFEKACLYHYHERLSVSERSELSKEAEKAVELVVDLAEYVDDPGAYGEKLGIPRGEVDFDACFPQTIDPADLRGVVEWYLGQVTNTVNMIRALK